jgi:DNA-binding NarL/FixJ family response regulator
MSAYNSEKKFEKISILINLKSLVLCEALHRSMSSDLNSCKIYAASDVGTLRNLKPDLTLVDHANLSQGLFHKWPDTRVILIDTGLSEENIISLMRSFKLYGVLSTEANFDQLKKALQVVHEGQIWIDNAKLKTVLHGMSSTPSGEIIERFSKKEARIIELVAEGHKNKEIASMLFLSEQTIKSHLGRIFRKMQVTNRSQLVSLIIKHNILNQHETAS